MIVGTVGVHRDVVQGEVSGGALGGEGSGDVGDESTGDVNRDVVSGVILQGEVEITDFLRNVGSVDERAAKRDVGTGLDHDGS